MIGFDPFTRSFLIDSSTIIDIEASGGTEFIIPTIRVVDSSFDWRKWRTSFTFFWCLFCHHRKLKPDILPIGCFTVN